MPEETLPPAAKNKKARKKRTGWLAVVLLLLLVAVFFLIYEGLLPFKGIIPGWKDMNSGEKSIAILPFINDSPDSSNIYFINGIMEGITDRLAHIHDLKVISRISAEKYRDRKHRTVSQIARDLGVNYIVEGSGQKMGDDVLITVQLIDALSDRHLLSKQYNRKVEDVFGLYSEIALDVANEIRAVITRDEMEFILNPGSVNLDALRLYIRGEKYFDSRHVEPDKAMEQVKKAEAYAREAIGLDSAFSDAWLLLCNVYLFRGETDSAMLLAQKALLIDDKNDKPYLMLGSICSQKGDAPAMEKWFKTALKYNPENYYATHMLGGLHYARGEFYEAFEALIKTRKMQGDLNPGLTHSQLFAADRNTLRLSRTLSAMGYYEAGKKYLEEWHSISNEPGDWGYNYNLMWAGIINNRLEETLLLGKATPEEDLCYDYMAMSLMFLGRYGEALDYLQESEEQMIKRGETSHLLNCLLGCCLLKTGDKQKSDSCFNGVLSVIHSLIRTSPEVAVPSLSYAITDRYWKFPYFVLSGIYAALGERKKALENLRLLRENYPASDLQVVFMLKNWPMFDSIRDEPQFREYLEAAEAHYLKERERVGKLLKAEGIIQ